MLLHLPIELLELILERCFPEDLLTLRFVNRRLSDIVRDGIDRFGLASVRRYYQSRAVRILDDYKRGRKPQWLRFMACTYLAWVMTQGFRQYASDLDWREIETRWPLGRTRATLQWRLTCGWWQLSRLAYIAQTCETMSKTSARGHLHGVMLWRRRKNAACSLHRSRGHPDCLRNFVQRELGSEDAANINFVLHVRDTTICPRGEPKGDVDWRHSGSETRTGLLRMLQRGATVPDARVSDFWRWEYAHILGGPALFVSQWALSSQDTIRDQQITPGPFERAHAARSAETAQRDRDRAIFVRQLLKAKAVGPKTVHLALFEAFKLAPTVWENDLVPVWITLPD